ncbi:MAG: DUF1552 domain-containing protein [Myxococcota bacterium]
MGLGTGSLFLPSLMKTSHGGGLGGPPKRIIFMMSYHGTVYENWQMRPGAPNENTEWEADLTPMAEGEFSPILQPLHAYRDRMMVLDGLDLVTIKPQGGGIGHFMSPINAMTGSQVTDAGPSSRATSPSLDQLIAQEIARPDHYASLEVGLGDAPISAPAAGQALPRETRADHLFDRLFPDAGSEEPTGPPTIGTRLRLAQGSMLDMVAGEYERLMPNLSAEDQHKLDLHRDMVRELEARLDGLAALDCTAPERPVNPMHSNPENYNIRVQQFSELLTIALACDMTRVATVTLPQMPNSAFGAPAGDVHQDYAHNVEAGNQTAITQMTNYNTRHAQHVASLLDLLAAVPEDNGTLLDNTLVVWNNEMANGSHRQDPYPMVLFGGANVPLRWGQYLFWPQNGPTPQGSNNFNSMFPSGYPQNHALVSMAQAMGLDVDSIGDTSVAGMGGETIDCTGAADRMLV